VAGRKAAEVADPEVKEPAQPVAPAAGDGPPPLYDPRIHTDPDQWVFTELYCTCGALWRQRDPVSYVEPQVRDFLARHAGEGHGPATKKACVAAREAKRKAAFVLRDQAHRYQPKPYPNLDAGCTKKRPWPVFPEPVTPPATETEI
jgi:hypothetical protein